MDETLVELLAGNRDHATEFRTRFDDVQHSQRPDVVAVSCSDSRVLENHIWGNDEPGRVFTCANIGNRAVQRTEVGTVVSGDLLYPIRHTGTDTAVVVGHTGCGAVTAAYDRLTQELSEPAGIRHCLDLLHPHVEASAASLPANVSRTEAINRLVESNVDAQVDALVESDDVPDDVTCVGVVYDFQDVYSGDRGEVHVVNVDGDTDPETLRDAHPEIGPRVERLWTPE